MKVYPLNTIEDKTRGAGGKQHQLTSKDKITRTVALIIAFISVFFFFFKILFF